MREPEVNGIVPLRREALDRATITLERAFGDDPMFRWIFPDPVRRSRSLRRLNRVPLEYGLRYGRVTQSDGGKAAAVWLPGVGTALVKEGLAREGGPPAWAMRRERRGST